MYSYQLDVKRMEKFISVSVVELGMSIPLLSDNTDYQRFKSDLANGVELKDADGNVMTSEQITEFLESLP
jgi:hypothetical protein